MSCPTSDINIIFIGERFSLRGAGEGGSLLSQGLGCTVDGWHFPSKVELPMASHSCNMRVSVTVLKSDRAVKWAFLFDFGGQILTVQICGRTCIAWELVMNDAFAFPPNTNRNLLEVEGLLAVAAQATHLCPPGVVCI